VSPSLRGFAPADARRTTPAIPCLKANQMEPSRCTALLAVGLMCAPIHAVPHLHTLAVCVALSVQSFFVSAFVSSEHAHTAVISKAICPHPLPYILRKLRKNACGGVLGRCGREWGRAAMPAATQQSACAANTLAPKKPTALMSLCCAAAQADWRLVQDSPSNLHPSVIASDVDIQPVGAAAHGGFPGEHADVGRSPAIQSLCRVTHSLVFYMRI
jgi:hypothetical protein